MRIFAGRTGEMNGLVEREIKNDEQLAKDGVVHGAAGTTKRPGEPETIASGIAAMLKSDISSRSHDFACIMEYGTPISRYVACFKLEIP
jgi:hypothetical protein